MEDSNPVLGALNWGMNGLDVCFNSQDRASNNLKLALLYTTDCYMQQRECLRLRTVLDVIQIQKTEKIYILF